MKERKISRRAVCSAMVASLALGVLEGCGSSSSTTASSAAGSGAAASNERITVRILKSKATNEVAAEQMDVWKVLGEKFNMDFEFDNPPQDNYNERLNLVMMDAQLPDIIMDMPTTEVLKYGESGVILSLNDYIENDMPNLKKEIDKRDGVEKALTYSDGNIYYMPMLDEKVSGNMPYIVRTDWLEKLGIESPVTLEDWENYWHLVKTTDLNGNGTNDEIPFSSYDMTGLLPTIIIMLILRMGSIFSVGYEKIMLMYNPATYETADVISTYVYRRAFESGDYSFSAAVGLFNSVINFTIIMLFNKFSKKISEVSLW